MLSGRRILLGVTGGIAAYKSADLVRRLRDTGAQVQVVMTEAATRFVGALTMQAVSGAPVRCDLLDPDAEAGMDHIELARWPDLVLIAPASADFMAKLSHGLANDLLSTLCLATDRPIALAPAMNRLMWSHAATRANRLILEERGVFILGPGTGAQACGETGPGRMLEPMDLLTGVEELLAEGGQALQGVRVLVTLGPTREPIDPVRFITNRSSGKMGMAIAEAALRQGARVTAVCGPISLPTPRGVNRIDVESAQQMLEAVLQRMGDSDVFIATAAVADYRVSAPATQKIKKTASSMQLSLERNPDILASVGSLDDGPFTVGFAAETENLIEHARGKLERKNLDMIVANQVGHGRGFEAEDNELHVLWAEGARTLPLAHKSALARDLVALIGERYHAQN